MPSQIFRSRNKTAERNQVPLNVIIDDGFTRRSLSVSIERGSSLRDIASVLPLDVQLRQHAEFGSWVTSINNLNEQNGFGWQFYIHDGAKSGLPYVRSSEGPAFLGLDNLRIDKPTNLEWKYEYYVDDITVPEHLRIRGGCSGKAIKLGAGALFSEFSVLSSEEINNAKEIEVNPHCTFIQSQAAREVMYNGDSSTENFSYSSSETGSGTLAVCCQYAPFATYDNLREDAEERPAEVLGVLGPLPSPNASVAIDEQARTISRISELTDKHLPIQTSLYLKTEKKHPISLEKNISKLKLIGGLSKYLALLAQTMTYRKIKQRVMSALDKSIKNILKVKDTVRDKVKNRVKEITTQMTASIQMKTKTIKEKISSKVVKMYQKIADITDELKAKKVMTNAIAAVKNASNAVARRTENTLKELFVFFHLVTKGDRSTSTEPCGQSKSYYPGRSPAIKLAGIVLLLAGVFSLAMILR